VTAQDAIQRAREAGLTLLPDPEGLRVRGPKSARAALLSVLAPLAGEILQLLAPDNRPPEAMTPGEPCSECGGTAWRVALISVDGDRTCGACATGQTALRRTGVPI
jgi:hypothetical protein